MSGAKRSDDFGSELKRRFGAQVDPSVSLDLTSLALTGQSPRAGDEVLGRLLHGNVERYVSLGEVARGGMGRIDRVWDRDLRRELAMKFLLEAGPEGARAPDRSDPRAIHRFVTEAQVTSQLNHPGVVPVHEIGFDREGRLYFTMRLIRGSTLCDVFQWTKAGHAEWNQQRVLRILLDVCDAVAYAHSRGVIHRDLKPSNVMVGAFGETYVMDWGLARVLQSDALPEAGADDRVAHGSAADHHLLQSSSGSVVGTPNYMAPEQASGSLEALHPQADVYSVGAMLYHLLAGCAPYSNEGASADARAVLERVRAEPPKPLSRAAPQVPAQLVAICERAMARDPASRYRDMQEMAGDLRAYLDQRVVRAYRTGAWAEISTWVRRNRAMAAAVLVAFVALVGGSGAVAWVTSSKNRQLSDARDRTQRSLDDVRKLAALKELRDLRQEADQIWPAWPAEVGRMREWLERGRALLGERGEHELARQRLLARASLADADRGTPRFTEAADAWWYESLVELLRELDDLATPDPRRVGTLTEMEERVRRATTIESRSVVTYSADWSEAIDSIGADPRFRGMHLVEQTGLVPLGSDPDSRLWEFWVVETGEMPRRDAASGRLALTETSGVVLVLLPGDPEYAFVSGYGPGPDFRSTPLTREPAPLAPFFLAKCELTQGQWLALTGTNPSLHTARSTFCGTQRHDLRCPVDTVSSVDFMRVLRTVGLSLPTAAQWQYAARAGTSTPWWTGDRIESTQGAANLRDRRLMSSFAMDVVALHVRWDDGFACSAQVGSFRPNAFGLHDTIGNVSEICLDRLPAMRNYRSHRRPGSGEQVVDDLDDVARDHPWMAAVMGQSFRTSPEISIGEIRLTELETAADDAGARPARALEE